MKRALKFVILLVTIVIMAGCVRDDTPTRSAITFSLYKTKNSIQKNGRNKGNDFKAGENRTKADRTKTSTRPKKFLVNAFLEEDNALSNEQSSFSQIPDFMCNQLVEWNPTSGSGRYEYSPIKYWPADPTREVKFFAYWLGGQELLTLNSSTGVYTAYVKDVDAKTDMLYSDDVIATNESGKVNFKMHHLLTSVSVKVKLNTNLPEDVKMNISKIKVTGVRPNGDLTLTPNSSVNAENLNGYSVQWTAKGTVKEMLVDEVESLILVPQSTQGIFLKVEYSFEQKNSLGKWVKYNNQKLSINLQDLRGVQNWETNKQYTYTFNVEHKKISFDTITVAPWSAGEISQEL